MAASDNPLHAVASPEEKEAEGENALELTLVAIDPTSACVGARGAYAGRRSRLLKQHTFPVTYPDGTEGQCSYERLGPACHRFDFRYEGGAFLSRQWWTYPLQNDTATIEEAGQNRTDDAFADAIDKERQNYFARATEPTDGSRKADPAKFRMTAGKAKEMGGRYALAKKLGSRFLRVSDPFKTLSDANTAWLEQRNPDLYVTCCNRLDRCWEIPKYNPLYKDHPELREGKEAKPPCQTAAP